MAGLALNPKTLMIASTVLSGVSSAAGGMAAGNAAESEAQQLIQRAKARRAEANARMREELRQGRLTRSRAQAVAAASGAGVDDPTVQRVIADIDADANYRALMAMYQGSEEAIGYERAAKNRAREGRAARVGGLLGAATSVLSGVSTLRTRYGGRPST